MLIHLTQNYATEVDPEDYAWLSEYVWHFKNGYAARSVGPRGAQGRLWMQNEILGVSNGVDHIDRNSLNNQRYNLRLATKSLQGHNRLMPKRELPRGVSLHHGKYQASIRADGKLIYLGRYLTPEEAEEAYLSACLDVHGELPPSHER
jgi:hypothetical protein